MGVIPHHQITKIIVRKTCQHFDICGNDGNQFVIKDKKDIAFISGNIKSVSMKKEGDFVCAGVMGILFT